MAHYLLLIKIFVAFTAPHAFEAQVIDANVAIGYGLAIGDVDGDKKPDILLADKKQFVWYRNGDWKKFVLAENLTAKDNVCIAARDINGDGKVEIAVGAQWDPSETSDTTNSGSVHYLVRPEDPTKRWDAIKLHHEPTTHRMKWVKSSQGKFYLVVAPLHGKGNRGGNGAGVKIFAYEFPGNPHAAWKLHLLDSTMHMTHNFEIFESDGNPTLIMLAGKEGVRMIEEPFGSKGQNNGMLPGIQKGVGELRAGKLNRNQKFLAAIEPMHGNELAVYLKSNKNQRILLDSNLREGHALAIADLYGNGNSQVIAGWRGQNQEGKTGIKIYSASGENGTSWNSTWLDENGMACEDLVVADLNADGRPDIIASGRATKNLKVYWNRR